MTRERIKAWVTKYYDTHGILCVEGEVMEGFDGMLEFRHLIARRYAKSGEWHRTERAAIDHAIEILQNRIAWHQGQIDKLKREIEELQDRTSEVQP